MTKLWDRLEVTIKSLMTKTTTSEHKESGDGKKPWDANDCCNNGRNDRDKYKARIYKIKGS
jgi:hypothetical protein